jgi:hypothetical protein
MNTCLVLGGGCRYVGPKTWAPGVFPHEPAVLKRKTKARSRNRSWDSSSYGVEDFSLLEVDEVKVRRHSNSPRLP